MAQLRAAILALALASSVRHATAERDYDGSMALSVEADTHFKRVAYHRAAVSSSTETLEHLGEAIVSHIQNISEEPKNIAEFHMMAQRTILEAIQLFSDLSNVNKEADIGGGISKIGSGLLDCVDFLMPKKVREQDYYTQFVDAWQVLFADLPTVDDDIQKHIDAYTKEAQVVELAQVVRICVNAGIDLMQRLLPQTALQAVDNYFTGITEIMDGIVESWEAFASGDTVQGITAAYDGLASAATAVLPESVQKNEAYKVIMKTLDTQMANLNDHVLRFKRKLQESKVCWRKTESRMKRYAQTCGLDGGWAGWYYAGHGVCRQGSFLELGDSSLEDALAGKKKKGRRPAPPPPPQRNALCDSASEFKEHIGMHCYKPCPMGYRPKHGGQQCITKCFGEKAFASTDLFGKPDDGVMCGASPQMIQMVSAEMLTAVVGAIINVVSVVGEMVKNGRVGADQLNALANEFVKLSIPFVNPTCPLEQPEAAPEQLQEAGKAMARAMVHPADKASESPAE